jgi:hypothetical protein
LLVLSKQIGAIGDQAQAMAGTRSDLFPCQQEKNSTPRPTSMQAPKTSIFAKNMAHVGMKCGFYALVLIFY